MIEFRCPQCEHFLRIPNAFGGKRGKCKYCGSLFEVPNGPFLPDPEPGTRGEPGRETPTTPNPAPVVPLTFQSLSDDLEVPATDSRRFEVAGDPDLNPEPQPKPPPLVLDARAETLLGKQIAGRHFSVWLGALGSLLGLFGLAIGAQLAGLALVYYLNFARDNDESWLFNKFTAPIWGALAFVTLPLGLLLTIISGGLTSTHVDQINETIYAIEYNADVYRQLAKNPATRVAPPLDPAPEIVDLPQTGVALLPLNLFMTLLSATVGTALTWLSVGLSFVITVAFMFPFYLLRRACEWMADAGGVLIFALLMICSGTIVIYLSGWIVLLMMFWLGRRILDIWGQNGEWGLAWRGFIYRQD